MTDPLTAMEQLKLDSRHLRGDIVRDLADPLTGAISEDSTKLLKFHGSYQQDDRDMREQRRQRKLEPDYRFMIRARLPGGVISPAQWLAFDAIARRYANASLRLTTRQTFQLHGVIKSELKPTIAAINAALVDTIAACGDVNRNVVASANPVQSAAHAEAYAWAVRLSEHLKPHTRAYHEIWLDGEMVDDGSLSGGNARDEKPSVRGQIGDSSPAHGGRHGSTHGADMDRAEGFAARADSATHAPHEESEPLYGDTYLPRKFKIGLAVPPDNDIDVFAQDLGLIAIIEDGQLAGFNIAVGGGMGATHGDPATYPQLADVIGFAPPEHILDLAWHTVAIQRDFGDRENRKHARFKYTLDDRGLGWFKHELETRSGLTLEPARPYRFSHNGDRYGWAEGVDGHWHLTLHVPSGRVIDAGQREWLTGLREIARVHEGDLRLTCNQNVIIAGVAPDQRAAIDALVQTHGLDGYRSSSAIRRHAVACVALPTCALAMAESERYLPELLPKIEALLERHGLLDEPILLRLSGCPNGCSRPYLGEIALVGRALGRYDLRLGADFRGQRLNSTYRENISEPQILEELHALFARYSGERHEDEHLGDFLVRAGVVTPPQRRIPLDTIA